MARRRDHRDDLDYAFLDAVRAGEERAEVRAELDAEEADALRALERIERALGSEAERAIDVPPEVDGRIVADAAAVLAAAPRRRFLRRLVVTASAAAALLAGTLFVWQPWRPAPIAVALRGDVDRSGTIDIVDAYQLALHLEHDAALEGSWDMNGDSAIDRRDVDAIALSSVALGGRP